MESHLQKSLDLLEKYLESDEGKKATEEYIQKIKEGEELLLKHHTRLLSMSDEEFEAILHNEFDLHGEEWRTHCYDVENAEPYPKEDLSNIIDVMFKYGSDNEPIGDSPFLSDSKYYKGWVIQAHHGQGVFYEFIKNDKVIFVI